MDNYNYFGGYGYGSNGDNTLIPKPDAEDVVNDKIDGLVGNAPEDLDTIAELAQKVQDIEEAIGSTDIGELKEQVDKKVDKETLESDYTNTEGMNEAIESAVSESAASKFGFVEYDSENKKIIFYDNESDKNELGSVDASEFIKDGMIDNVEISGGNLVITFNTDSEKETITLSLTDIFDASNYYTKEEVDAELEKKLDKTEIDNYYSKEDVDSEFEKYYNKEDVDGKLDTLNAELSNKANNDDVYTKGEVDSKISAIDIPVVPTNISAFTNDAGYITEHQSLEEYAKKTDLDAYQVKGDYVTVTQLGEKDFATVTSVNEGLEGKMDKVELAEVAISGSYNDLTDKPNIPEGVIVDTELDENSDNAISNKAVSTALSGKADKNEIPSLEGYAKTEDVESAIANKVDWTESENGRMHIVLKNHDSVLGTATNGETYNVAMVSKWDVADFGSGQLHMNLNSTDGKVTINDNKVVATKDEIPNVEGFATKEELTNSIAGINIPTKVSELENDENYLKEHQSLAGLFKSVEYDSVEKKINFKDENNEVVGYVDATDFVKDGMVNEVRVDENNNLVITFNTDSGKETISVSLGNVFEPANYYTKNEIEANYFNKTESDVRYYEKENANSVFVAKTTLENYSTTEQMETAIESAVEPKADKSSLEATVHELVVRLNKLESTNAVLIEKGTDTPENIATKGADDDVVAATDEAIKALSTNKTFKNVSIVGGEVGSNDVIYLTATDNISVDGITVSGEKGTGNGKIVYAGNDINISNVNIEPGCTVYNVFEGSQDKNAEHCVDNFTAKNVTVNDTDLKHNVFNIYQLNEGANVKISDSSFNLNMKTSNIMRLSNYTNAKNVTVTFENVDWTYENMPYADGDLMWAGLIIYQPAGADTNVKTGDEYSDEATKTWTFNFINCRYNGEKVTGNSFGTNKQVIYQYNVKNEGKSEDPTVFGAINFE